MNHNEEKNNIESDLDESSKNEEDLLGYSSKYKTNIYKEDKEDVKENESIPKEARKRLSDDSTSISQEFSGISGSNSKKINILPSKDNTTHRSTGLPESSKKFIEYQEKQRKMSSPLCFYYDGSDAYLSKILKNIIDMNKSQNFIKKENFFNNSDNINNNNFINNNLIDDNKNLNINILKRKKNNENENIEKNNEIKKLSNYFKQIPYNINNYNSFHNNIFNNYLLNNNNNYQRQIYNINFINLNNFSNNQINPVNNINRRKLTYNFEDIGNYVNNILNLNNNINISQIQQKLNPFLFSYNEEQEIFNKKDNKKSNSNKAANNNKDKKHFDKRKGDWLCPECHNLNFSFRVVCNRCQFPKPADVDTKNGQ